MLSHRHQPTSTILYLLGCFAIACFGTLVIGNAWGDDSAEAKTSKKLYEVRFYVANPGKLGDLHNRFRNHTLRLFEKHGMENIIYWDVLEGDKTDGEKAANTMIYIIAHKDDAARDASWKAFFADPEWQAAAAKSEENGKILAEAPRVILMRETDYSPVEELGSIATSNEADSVTVYELRQYNDGPDRVPFTVERFGSGEIELFTKNGMTTPKFWTATDNSAFIYVLGHKSRDAAKVSWAGFMKEFGGFLEEYRKSKPQPPATAAQGKGFEARYLVPTDYSPRK